MFAIHSMLHYYDTRQRSSSRAIWAERDQSFLVATCASGRQTGSVVTAFWRIFFALSVICMLFASTRGAAAEQSDLAESIKEARSLVQALANQQTAKASMHSFFEFQKHAEKFAHILDDVPQKDLSALLASNEAQLRYIGIYLSLLLPKRYPGDLCQTLLSLYSSQPNSDSAKILVSVGFLPVAEVDKNATALLATIPKYQTDVQAGLLSYYWRSSGDVSPLTGLAATPLNSPICPAKEYIEVLLQKRTPTGLTPGDWRRIWEGSNAPTAISMRTRILESIASWPDAPEAKWIVEQAIKEPSVKSELINTLWFVRTHGGTISQSAGLRTWLEAEGKSVGSSPEERFNSISAVGLSYFLYQDTKPFTNILPDLLKNAEPTLTGWSRTTEILLTTDPSNTVLDSMRAAWTKRDAQGKFEVGAEWSIWLLDLRRGRKVDSPPLASLAELLRTDRAAATCAALSSAAEKTYPWLDQLRDPCVFLMGSGISSRNMMQYLGVLDRLELAKRKIALKN